MRIHRAWSHFLILSICVHLADTRPTALAYESITRASTIISSHAIYGKAGHAFVSYCQLGSHNIALSHRLSTYPDDVPYIIAFASILVSMCQTAIIFSSLSTAVHFRRATGPSKPSTCTTASKPQRNSNPNPKQTHCEHCYDYDSIRCRSTVVMALFAFVIASHDTSHSPQIDTLPPPDARRSPEVWG